MNRILPELLFVSRNWQAVMFDRGEGVVRDLANYNSIIQINESKTCLIHCQKLVIRNSLYNIITRKLFLSSMFFLCSYYKVIVVLPIENKRLNTSYVK